MVRPRFEVPGVGPDTPLRLAAAALLSAKAEPLFALEADARGGTDVDAVHDMRVASRRLREAMRLLAPLYPQKEFRVWYRRVRDITRSLGPVRDSDVFVEEFADLAEYLDEGGKRCVAFMIGYRTSRRERELEVLNEQMHRLDLGGNRRAFERLVQAVADSDEAWSPLHEYAHAAVAERAAVVFSAQPQALPVENVEQQHALRIDYKRLRYAVEAFASCYGTDFDGLHATLTAFQDTLGELHDLHVFQEMLRVPERIVAAERAGVSAADIAQVEALLDRRAHENYLAFLRLAEKHPPTRLLAELLLPLSQGPRRHETEPNAREVIATEEHEVFPAIVPQMEAEAPTEPEPAVEDVPDSSPEPPAQLKPEPEPEPEALDEPEDLPARVIVLSDHRTVPRVVGPDEEEAESAGP